MNLSPGRILEDDNRNHQIQNEVVKIIEMKKGNIWSKAPSIAVHMKDGKYEFVFHGEEVKKLDAIIEDLNKLFPDRFVVIE